LIETYRTALFGGETSAGSNAAGAPHDVGQPGDRAGHRRSARSTISLLSAFAIVYFRFRCATWCSG
jgi:sn-glycerol 3-phosphate transport system permease protein